MTLKEATAELRRITGANHAMLFATGTSDRSGETCRYHACVGDVFNCATDSIEGLLAIAVETMAARRLENGDVELDGDESVEITKVGTVPL